MDYGRILVLGLIALLVTSHARAAQTDRYTDLVRLLQKNPATGQPVQDLEELLPLLPEEMLSNFTFIYQSRSPHGELGERSVDPLHPRILLFSKDGRLSLSFTGNPTQPGYNTMEVIHFEDQTASFQLSQFALPKSKGKDLNAPANGAINPAQCLRCHGADPKPISDSYPLWPGFYGSVRDTFPKGSDELPWYQQFLREEAKKGLYQKLHWPKGSSVPPYLDPKRYNKNTIEASFDELTFLPNTRLGMAWTELNRKRIQRKIKQSERFASARYRLLSGLLGCSKFPIPTSVDEEVYRGIYYENEDRLIRLGYRPKGPGKDSLIMMELGMYKNLSEIEYLAHVLNIDTSDWSMAYESHSFSYFDGILSSVYAKKDFYLKEDFLIEELRDLVKDDPAFLPYFATYYAYPGNQSFGERLDIGKALGACALLKIREKTEKPLPAFQAKVTAQASHRPEASELMQQLKITHVPFERCTHCHEGTIALLSGRKIPFSSPSDLAVALQSKSKNGKPLAQEIEERLSIHGTGQMPPRGDRLSDDDTKELKAYLLAVKNLSEEHKDEAL